MCSIFFFKNIHCCAMWCIFSLRIFTAVQSVVFLAWLIFTTVLCDSDPASGIFAVFKCVSISCFKDIYCFALCSIFCFKNLLLCDEFCILLEEYVPYCCAICSTSCFEDIYCCSMCRYILLQGYLLLCAV